jgi:hypothetical protein
MNEDEVFDLAAISLFTSPAVVAHAQGFQELIPMVCLKESRGIGGKNASRHPGLGILAMGRNHYERRLRPGHSFAPKHV